MILLSINISAKSISHGRFKGGVLKTGPGHKTPKPKQAKQGLTKQPKQAYPSLYQRIMKRKKKNLNNWKPKTQPNPIVKTAFKQRPVAIIGGETLNLATDTGSVSAENRKLNNLKVHNFSKIKKVNSPNVPKGFSSMLLRPTETGVSVSDQNDRKLLDEWESTSILDISLKNLYDASRQASQEHPENKKLMENLFDFDRERLG